MSPAENPPTSASTPEAPTHEQPMAPVSTAIIEVAAQKPHPSFSRVATMETTSPAVTPPAVQAGTQSVEQWPPLQP